MANGNDSAFDDKTWRQSYNRSSYERTSPLTKREYFAAIALQGLLANSEGYEDAASYNAKQAVCLADDLILALNGE